MSINKYVPSLTQTIQVVVIVAVMGALGVLAKSTGLVNKVLGRF